MVHLDFGGGRLVVIDARCMLTSAAVACGCGAPRASTVVVVARPSMWSHPGSLLGGTVAAARVLVATALGGLRGALRSRRLLEARLVDDASALLPTSQ